MSASLVGSEMCIRDRVSPREGGRREGSWEKSRGSHLGTPCPYAWHPVSYTHLTLPTICSV
eukprot:13634023-Alexandrium_andersonii.AAC.1